jgi:hypothetical protein
VLQLLEQRVLVEMLSVAQVVAVAVLPLTDLHQALVEKVVTV